MRQGTITAAYNKIRELYRIKGVPFQISVELLRIKRELQLFVDCQGEQEEQIAVEISGGMIADGTYPMDQAQQAEFMRRLAEIQKTEVAYDLPPAKIKVTRKLVDLLGITGEVMDVLDGFVVFELEEEGGDPE